MSQPHSPSKQLLHVLLSLTLRGTAHVGVRVGPGQKAGVAVQGAVGRIVQDLPLAGGLGRHRPGNAPVGDLGDDPLDVPEEGARSAGIGRALFFGDGLRRQIEHKYDLGSPRRAIQDDLFLRWSAGLCGLRGGLRRGCGASRLEKLGDVLMAMLFG